jgi:type I restriction enzyme S subunit
MVAQTLETAFKKTDIGAIPKDWALDSLKNLADIKTGAKNTQDKIDDGQYPFFVRSQKIERINTYSFDGEAVLTAGDGVGTGKVFHYITGKFDFHQRVYKISDFSDRLDGYYFFLYFSNAFFNRIMSMTAKSSVDSVRMEMIANMLIPLPEKGEQKAIAKAVNDINSLIESLNRLVEKKKLIKQAAMQELLTGKRRLPRFGFNTKYKISEKGLIPEDWLVKKIGELLKVRHGKSQREVVKINGKYPILATGGEIGRADEYLYNKPSVLIGRKGTIDKPRYVSTPFWTVDTLFYTEVFYDYSPKYLFYKLNTINWYSYNEASGVPSLNSKTIEGIKISVPSTLNEQTAIADVLTDIDVDIEGLKQRMDKCKQLKVGLMQQLLTGRIRLKWKS